MKHSVRGDFQPLDHQNVPPILGRSAKAELDRRKVRARVFGRALTREVAWEILLTLYVDEGAHRNTIGTLVKSADVPLTTALRWLLYLEGQSLISRHPHPTDGRRVFIDLTEKGVRALNTYFLETLEQQA